MGMTLRGERAEMRRRSVTSDEITYERTYVVVTDSDNIGPRAVSFCAGLPLMGSIYATSTETDPLVRVVSRDAAPVDPSRQLWEVTVRYSSKQEEGDGDNEEEQDEIIQVELEPPEVSLTHATRTKAILGKIEEITTYVEGQGYVTIGGNKTGVCSSAGEPFDPPAEDEEHYPILTVTRNEANLDMARVRSYIGSVNSDVWLGAQPRQVKCSAIDARKVRKTGFNFWKVTYVVEFNNDTWDLQVLDIGTYYIDKDDGDKKKLFVTDDEPPQPRLGLLDGEGGKLADGADPVFRRYQRRDKKPFAALNLEASIFG